MDFANLKISKSVIIARYSRNRGVSTPLALPDLWGDARRLFIGRRSRVLPQTISPLRLPRSELRQAPRGAIGTGPRRFVTQPEALAEGDLGDLDLNFVGLYASSG